MDEEEKVCGTCKYNSYDRMVNEWVCDCEESECYGVGTMYSDFCGDWEQKE